MKKEILKKWWFWTIAFIMVASISTAVYFGVKYYQVSAKLKTENVAGNIVKKSAKQNPAAKKISAKLYSLNEPAKYMNMSLTVTSVDKSDGSSTLKPNDGMMFVIVNLKVENSGKDNIAFDPSDFQLRSGNGDINSASLGITVNGVTASKASNISAGNNGEEAVIFQVPKNASKFTLSYKNHTLNNNKTIRFKLY